MVFILTAFNSSTLFAQHTEIHFNGMGGMFNYSGSASNPKTTAIFNSAGSPNWRAESPFDSKFNFSYILELEVKRILKGDVFFGAGLSYQQMNNKTSFDSMYAIGVIVQRFEAGGEVNLKNSFISLRPFVGKRIGFKSISVDLSAGVDLALLLRSREDATVIGETGNSVHFYYNRKDPKLDIRPGVRAKFNFDKVGVLLGFSKGVTPYKSAFQETATTNVVYLGLSFRSW